MPNPDGSMTETEIMQAFPDLMAAIAQLQNAGTNQGLANTQLGITEAYRMAAERGAKPMSVGLGQNDPNAIGFGQRMQMQTSQQGHDAQMQAQEIQARRDELAQQLAASHALERMRMSSNNAQIAADWGIASQRLQLDAWQTAEEIAARERQFAATFGLQSKQLLADTALGLGQLQSQDAANYAAHNLGLANYNLGMRQTEAQMAADPGRWVEMASYLRGQDAPQGGPSGLPAFAVDPTYRAPDYSRLNGILDMLGKSAQQPYTPGTVSPAPTVGTQPAPQAAIPTPNPTYMTGAMPASQSLPMPTNNPYGGFVSDVGTNAKGRPVWGAGIPGYAEGTRGTRRSTIRLPAPIPGDTQAVESPPIATLPAFSKRPIEGRSRPIGEPDPQPVDAATWNANTLAQPMIAPNPGVNVPPLDPRTGGIHAPTWNANTMQQPLTPPMPSAPASGSEPQGTGYFNNMTLEQLMEYTRVQNPFSIGGTQPIQGGFRPGLGGEFEPNDTSPQGIMQEANSRALGALAASGGANGDPTGMAAMAQPRNMGAIGNLPWPQIRGMLQRMGMGGMGGMGGGMVPGLPMGGMLPYGQGQDVIVGENGPEKMTVPPGTQVEPLTPHLGVGQPMYNVTPANGPAQAYMGQGGMVPENKAVVPAMPPQNPGMPQWIMSMMAPGAAEGGMYMAEALGSFGGQAYDPYAAMRSAQQAYTNNVYSPVQQTNPQAGLTQPTPLAMPQPVQPVQSPQQQAVQQTTNQVFPTTPVMPQPAPQPTPQPVTRPAPVAPAPIAMAPPQNNPMPGTSISLLDDIKKLLQPPAAPVAPPATIPAPMPTLPGGGASTGTDAGANGLGFSGTALWNQPWLQSIVNSAPMPAWSGAAGQLAGPPVLQVPGQPQRNIPAPHQFNPLVWARMNPQERQQAEALYRSVSITPDTLREGIRRQLPGMVGSDVRVGGWR